MATKSLLKLFFNLLVVSRAPIQCGYPINATLEIIPHHSEPSFHLLFFLRQQEHSQYHLRSKSKQKNLTFPLLSAPFPNLFGVSDHQCWEKSHWWDIRNVRTLQLRGKEQSEISNSDHNQVLYIGSEKIIPNLSTIYFSYHLHIRFHSPVMILLDATVSSLWIQI